MEDMEGLVAKVPLNKLITSLGILSVFLFSLGMLLEKWLVLEAANMVLLAAISLFWSVLPDRRERQFTLFSLTISFVSITIMALENRLTG